MPKAITIALGKWISNIQLHPLVDWKKSKEAGMPTPMHARLSTWVDTLPNGDEREKNFPQRSKAQPKARMLGRIQRADRSYENENGNANANADGCRDSRLALALALAAGKANFSCAKELSRPEFLSSSSFLPFDAFELRRLQVSTENLLGPQEENAGPAPRREPSGSLASSIDCGSRLARNCLQAFIFIDAIRVPRRALCLVDCFAGGA
ncbi:hypothetical protein Mp_7g07140 [Marchantia polymorpha subsp. ruderalis]|uniref:Uncharacterized protein n=2 Tax=Marchantia polymorpha TaxID=3197 RepID=A0AAF6BWZ8_MARPO|nr:hypothetical protein MARPO_0076s0080 [Marchantia polymorpha]BBN16532.1 hypothetical protein Mp_7g07140 [Marchantia polymorpha subsp. ruderalis]|eukprot:PTQ34846.1 hypothetical protein MARPO_0076s0080 [Marchantia polymorpha]